MRLYLVRHGETAWNAAGRLQGSTDVPLNDTGRAQARALAAAFSRFAIAHVFTSDLQRSRETGTIIAESLGLPPPEVERDLRERRFGIFEGLTRDEIHARYPDQWRAWTGRTAMPEGGEPVESSVGRMRGALERVWAQLTGPALVISHGGIMRLWLSDLAGHLLPNIANGATFVVERDGTAFRARPL
ncbi:MAG TPA: histidine phosphatase family protein [Kofleriaceae bacterium]|nr:histidine phosphatase family protein [Kofleriaceae bacterium]